jgi:SAM-dependent methyltransferase
LWRVATTKAIAPRKGMRVLDLAAGTGTSSAAIAAHGAHVVAADFSEGMLAEGRKRHAMVFQKPVMLRRSARANLLHALRAVGENDAGTPDRALPEELSISGERCNAHAGNP